MKNLTKLTVGMIVILLSLQNCYSFVKPLQLGVNLDDNGAFVNIINHTNRYSKAAGFDSLGWAKSDFDLILLDKRPVPEWAGSIDDPEKYRVDYSGRYKSSFSGSANVSVSGTSVTLERISYDSLANTTFFDIIVGGYPNANHGFVILSFKNTRRTSKDTLNSGITNLKVMRPGYELATPKIFTDEYITLCKAANFACYRFYNVQNVWEGEPTFPTKTTWDKRKTPSDAAQQTLVSINGKRDGWCWEYIIELSNILKKDIWICIHISCDSDYVANLAKLLKEKLDPSINIYIENSNEVWSPTQASFGPYNQAQAKFYGITFDENYARRAVELSNWFSAVFGKDEINNRIRVILSGQQSYSGRSDNHLSYIKKTFGEPKDFIYATSTALYFGSTKSNDTDPLIINQGMKDNITDQVTNKNAGAYRLNHINKAKTWGLKGGCTSYEGGPGVPSGGGTDNLENQILANRTEQMGEVVKFNYTEGWSELDGGLALYFTLVSGYNRYGCWGITDDYTKPDRNFKMKAMRELTNKPVGIDISKNDKTDGLTITYNNETSSINVNTFRSIKDVEMYNVLGSVVSKSNCNVISTSNCTCGLYFISVSLDNSEQYVLKFIYDGYNTGK
ncbi:MAG: hypothetical protein HYZ54_02505 [Ignavibacteriae bacterium]|nr:hypothetical protein [Ignavibacteriota bacterium]